MIFFQKNSTAYIQIMTCLSECPCPIACLKALGVVRTLFRNPGWIILDECVSAMPDDAVVECYRLFQERGISLVSINCNADKVRHFHTEEIDLGEQHPRGWSISTLDPGHNVGDAEVEMPGLGLASSDGVDDGIDANSDGVEGRQTSANDS